MANELTVKRMISFDGRNGTYVDFDTISKEQRQEFLDHVSKSVSEIACNMATRISKGE